MPQYTPIRQEQFGRDLRTIDLSKQEFLDQKREILSHDFPKMGVDIKKIVSQSHAMDDIQQLMMPASMATPVQNLQVWLPGFIRYLTQPKKADEIMGIMNAGSWSDEEVIFAVEELTGKAVPYGDFNDFTLADFNLGFNRRNIIRFEIGIEVGILEEERLGKINVNSIESKRQAALQALDSERNAIAFYGFNSGLNLTYGFLNDPNLPGYITLPTGASGSTYWSRKDVLEIIADIRLMIITARMQAGDNFNPEDLSATLVVPTSVIDYLTVTSYQGFSVKEWLRREYPKLRVISVMQLDKANGGLGVAYLFIDQIDDGSTDSRSTIMQVVPTRFRSLGSIQDTKVYREDTSNATAGIIVARPWAVVRATGISN